MDDFEKTALKTLAELAERIEDSRPGLDTETSAGIMTIDLPDGGQYVLNLHRPMRELWLSSPKSGAWHFRLSQGVWLCTRTGREMQGILADELGF
jgi:frataxin